MKTIVGTIHLKNSFIENSSLVQWKPTLGSTRRYVLNNMRTYSGSGEECSVTDSFADFLNLIYSPQPSKYVHFNILLDNVKLDPMRKASPCYLAGDSTHPPSSSSSLLHPSCSYPSSWVTFPNVPIFDLKF